MDNGKDNRGCPENPCLAGVRTLRTAMDSCGTRFVPGSDRNRRSIGFYGETLGK